MAQPLGMGQHTVSRARRMATLPARKRRTDRGRSILTPDHAYRLERWNAGHRDASQLFQELQRQGSSGRYPTVARDAQRLRQAQGQTLRQRRPRQALPAVAAPSDRHRTARRATWLVRRRPERQDEAAQLRAQQPEVAAAIAFARDFAQRVRERTPERGDRWLARAAESPLTPLQRLARGSALTMRPSGTLPWSHGPVEGQMNRLQRLQRQLFGRAKLDLLQQRFRLAA